MPDYREPFWNPLSRSINTFIHTHTHLRKQTTQMETPVIPTMQWAQVVEKAGGRMSLSYYDAIYPVSQLGFFFLTTL